MRRKRAVIVSSAVLSALLAGAIGTGAALWDDHQDAPSARTAPAVPSTGLPAAATCADGGIPISHRFAAGSAWQMCWRIDPHAGLVLSQIRYLAPGREPLPVMKELTLGQLEVPYDTGLDTTRDITEAGFGGRSMIARTAVDCAGERIDASVPDFGTGAVGGAETRAVLCAEERDTGLGRRSSYRGRDAASRGHSFDLSTLSIVGWYEYLTVYSFADNGAITPQLGATGALSPKDHSTDPRWGSPAAGGAVSHSHNAVWRIRWDLGGPQTVQEYNAEFTGRTGPKAPVVTGSWTSLTHETTRRAAPRRFWRVLSPHRNPDGHRISYTIFNDATAGHGYDMAFSQRNPCELYASDNLLAGCPTDTVRQFVSDHQRLSDVVSWVAVSFHHVPRPEDRTPMEMHWQGFTTAPFAAFPHNPLGQAEDVNS
ncbi:copper amine oxidase [Nonomuraea sp. NN258]|uniref:copper amine oxidase n=1 Tax=Nonomuraea antri TaxID=2730852 RepID=UPI001568F20A|nr:copper amine oxidase [Nonomuraea antri]NRQ32406.1 copper amine oxidase [Nonomuraea antri]